MAHSAREEELLIIRSIYCDAYNTFNTVDDTHFIFRSVPIALSLTLPLTYPDPSYLPEISLDSDGPEVNKLQLFELQMRLDSILHSKPDEPVLFELTEETREFTESLRNDITTCFDEEEEEEVNSDMYVDSNELDRRISDLAIVKSHMGSTTLADIMSRLPSTIKLLHAEVVMRTDLREKYQAMRRKIQQTATQGLYDRRKKDATWTYFGKEEIVFHGTPRHNVSSIVRSGFIVPGEKTSEGTRVDVRCGSTWGRVLPLYVLHLGQSRHASGPEHLALIKTPMEGNLTYYARKHLPNGFGTASGHQFTVLEIAPIDDDEELWGEYQHTDGQAEGEFQDEQLNSRASLLGPVVILTPTIPWHPQISGKLMRSSKHVQL
ncbi:hypothetical protein H0H87_000206 [Tephrocybe sp. NHM501043]|nr:hypothetical protein H0H87_000206 [Tephrocybe sp. NHM501043]